MTTTAIGDNLVKKPFLKSLSKLTRSFTIKRGLPARELLESSKVTSAYIKNSILRENRSVWIAQREGRTKDGNDETHKGVLKMISMAAGNENIIDYFKKINIVPISISYEYDPTDVLKMPELLAKAKSETYVKGENEDFMTLLNGIIGQKKRIHIHVGNLLNDKIQNISDQENNPNKQFQAIADLLDRNILAGYKLWPTNYIAYDILHKTNQYSSYYTEKEKQLFERRLELKIDTENPVLLEGFLAMYANPVVNKMKYQNATT
jgi:hypothetical protein